MATTSKSTILQKVTPPTSYLRRAKISKSLVHLIMILIALIFITPFIVVVAGSFSSEKLVNLYGYRLWPVGFSLEAYKYVFLDPSQILNSYQVSMIVTMSGTMLGLLISSMLGYSLSRTQFSMRRFFSFIVYFTILFSGGIVPFYILMTQVLHLKDNLLALVLPHLVVPWYVLILRTYFKGLPEEVLDSARVDGANEFRIFFQIAIPLSLPALATIGLFYVLMYWNDWFTALLFISNTDQMPLQYLLHKIMANLAFLTNNMDQLPTGMIPPPLPMATIRMALAVLGAAPIAILFLFLQKYFVSGLTIGALKGD